MDARPDAPTRDAVDTTAAGVPATSPRPAPRTAPDAAPVVAWLDGHDHDDVALLAIRAPRSTT